MKILHISPTYLPAYQYGGPIYSVHGLCRALKRMGHDCHVYTTDISGKEKSDVPLETIVDVDGVKITYFQSPFAKKIFYSPSMKKALMLNIKDFDVLHLHSPYVWPTWMAASEAFRRNKPYVMTTRGMLVKELIRKKNFWLKSIWIYLIERRNLEHAALVHFTTSAEEKQVGQFGFHLKKTIILGHGIDSSDESAVGEQPREDIKPFLDGKPFLLYVGRISWEKGLDRLIDAMIHVKDISLILVGNNDSDYAKKLKSLARANNIADRVVFVGAYYGSVKWDLYKKATAFVLPSFSENFGNVILEALLQGCPVIVTSGVGLADFVRESQTGLVVDNNAGGLARAINQLLSSSALRSQMKIAGPKAVHKNFMWDKIADKMSYSYKQLSTSNH